jgi:hypothetical protein
MTIIHTWPITFGHGQFQILEKPNFTMSSKFHCPCNMLHQYHHAHGDISLMSFIHIIFTNFIYASGPLWDHQSISPNFVYIIVTILSNFIYHCIFNFIHVCLIFVHFFNCTFNFTDVLLNFCLFNVVSTSSMLFEFSSIYCTFQFSSMLLVSPTGVKFIQLIHRQSRNRPVMIAYQRTHATPTSDGW